MVKRIFDLFLVLILIILLTVPMLLILLLIKVTSKGPAIFRTNRVGLNNRIFRMFKFRTMVVGTPQLATHLMNNPERYLTPFGELLRKYSLDELPQLFNIFSGQMSFVGPRPALFNQDDLIALRTDRGVHLLTPGVTGWAQINGRDDLSIPDKVAFDEYYFKHRSLILDLKIIVLTVIKAARREGVKH